MTDAVTGLPAPNDLDGIPESAIYAVPRALVSGVLAERLIAGGQALRLCGRSMAFAAVEVAVRKPERVDRHASSVTAFDPWRRVLKPNHRDHVSQLIENLSAHRSPFAGLRMDRTQIMGIVNVAPDSFSDGGDHATPETAITHAVGLAEAGADILDVGGESTRPGARPVTPDDEQRRVLPVIRTLAEKGLVVSIDTRHATTMGAALDAGATVVNDVTALKGDSRALNIIAQHNAPVVLVHMQGEPRTMQSDPSYVWTPADIFDALADRIQVCISAGLDKSSICVDPGIGFGKNDSQNLDLLNAVTILHGLGCPVMLGASRKSFIGRLSDTADPKKRLAGSVAVAVSGAAQGVQFLRVHDAMETRQALTIAHAIEREGEP